MPLGRSIPILIAAFGPRMLRRRPAYVGAFGGGIFEFT
jgi:hypothetical protein